LFFTAIVTGVFDESLSRRRRREFAFFFVFIFIRFGGNLVFSHRLRLLLPREHEQHEQH
jgi:hypothetical protein